MLKELGEQHQDDQTFAPPLSLARPSRSRRVILELLIVKAAMRRFARCAIFNASTHLTGWEDKRAVEARGGCRGSYGDTVHLHGG